MLLFEYSRKNSLSTCLAVLLCAHISVEILSLSQNSLNGTISTQIGRLTNLGKENLFEEALEGCKAYFCHFVGVSEVYGSDLNQLEGRIPSEIGMLTQMGELCREQASMLLFHFAGNTEHSFALESFKSDF